MHSTTEPVRRIQHLVCSRKGVSLPDLLSHRRPAYLAQARHMAIWLARQTTRQSLPRIGRQFGPRDHTTILHSIQTVDAMMVVSPDFGAEMAELLMEVGRG